MAILAADVAGYSRLMGIDERSTVAALEAARMVFRAEIEGHQGAVIDMTGDSVLAAFGSAAGAVAAAIAIQCALHRGQVDVVEERRMRFRIGVHLGDVFEKSDGTIYGDGVNIAARLEGLAEAGGIALSDAVERAVRGKISQTIRHQGAHRVKNVAEPLNLYAVQLPWQAQSIWSTARRRRFNRVAIISATIVLIVALAVGMLWSHAGWQAPRVEARSERVAVQIEPSIAVLPFADLSEGKDQSYFSDGLSEEVIDRLAQIPQLRVIARTSSFALADSHASPANIARQLNVATLLEGSVRRSVDRIRVSAQLVRASDSSYLWSGTYERKLTDIFAVQDEIANAVVAALKVKLNHAINSAAANRYLPKPEAYDEYLLGRQLMRTRPDHYEEHAVEAFARAVAIDQNYAAALAALAFAQAFVAENELDPKVRGPLMDQALAAAERAVAADPSEPDAVATRGFLRFEARWDVAGADADLSKAFQMDPTAEPTLTKYGFFLMCVGRGDEAMALTKKIRETDPFFAPPWEIESRIEAARGDFAAAEDSLRHAHSILQINPESGELVAVFALLRGEPERARRLFVKLADPAHSNWGVALAEQDLNHPAAAQKALRAFVVKSPYEYYKLGVAYARTLQREAAFAALSQAYATRDTDMEYILIDPLLAPLRADARYGRLLDRLGLSASKQ